MSSASEPSEHVFSAFGADPDARERLDGGRGLTWRAGPVVLRPTGDIDEATWRAGVLESLDHTPEFRTPRPIRAASGSWFVDGWEAWQWVPGAANESRLSDVIKAGEAFHRAIAGLERPAFIDTSDDPWVHADRMAWEEETLPSDPTLDRLATRFRSVESAPQVIHGDLLGNVLFAPHEAPTIIDWAPYWRPAGLGTAIAVVDAVTWHSAPIESMSELVRATDEPEQMLVRALTFRMATLHLLEAWDLKMNLRHAPVVDAVMDLAR